MSNNFQRVHEAMLRVAEGRGLDGQTVMYRNPRLAVLESVAHELAHQLDYGRNFDARLAKIRPWYGAENGAANLREESTLRIEVTALALLGVRLSLRKLWRDANWWGDRPRFHERALTERERKCVTAFVRIVRKEMGAA
jgi:hypothetical protein